MEILQPACLLHPPGQQALLVQALFEAGLPLAMGLERSPRPLVRWGHPLPQGVPGRSEWADVVLRTAPEESLRTLPESINAQASEGLRVLEAQPLSNHATPVLELCREARWAWSCPQDVLPMALERCSAFMAAESFQIEKMGKVGGQKQVKPLEIRPLVLRMAWEGERLHFVTRLSAGEALNPLKLMAGVLGLEAAQIKGLVRLGVDLIEDSRLATADKYETKLHNMFEDAVLLESGAHIRVLDEDDDEPLVWRS
jgi:radical SAM-linked protein